MPHRPKFDEPWMDELDGHDCVQKSVTLGVKAAMVGVFTGAAYSALKIPDPEPTPLILQSFIKMKNHSLFLGGTVTAFALTTCTAASMRETDDPTNWALGGAASAAFMGLARRSWGIGCIMMPVLAGAGALAKYTGVYKHPFPTDRMYS